MDTRALVGVCIAVSMGMSTGLTGCESGGDGETVGPRGGVLVSEDGRLTLEIPEGALDNEVEISIHQVEDPSADGAGAEYKIGPTGTGFSVPVVVTYDWVEGEMGVPPSQLALMVRHGERWNYLADREVDMEDQTVSGGALYLSAFAVVAKP